MDFARLGVEVVVLLVDEVDVVLEPAMGTEAKEWQQQWHREQHEPGEQIETRANFAVELDTMTTESIKQASERADKQASKQASNLLRRKQQPH